MRTAGGPSRSSVPQRHLHASPRLFKFKNLAHQPNHPKHSDPHKLYSETHYKALSPTHPLRPPHIPQAVPQYLPPPRASGHPRHAQIRDKGLPAAGCVIAPGACERKSCEPPGIIYEGLSGVAVER